MIRKNSLLTERNLEWKLTRRNYPAESRLDKVGEEEGDRKESLIERGREIEL